MQSWAQKRLESSLMSLRGYLCVCVCKCVGVFVSVLTLVFACVCVYVGGGTCAVFLRHHWIFLNTKSSKTSRFLYFLLLFETKIKLSYYSKFKKQTQTEVKLDSLERLFY